MKFKLQYEIDGILVFLPWERTSQAQSLPLQGHTRKPNLRYIFKFKVEKNQKTWSLFVLSSCHIPTSIEGRALSSVSFSRLDHYGLPGDVKTFFYFNTFY